MRSINPQPCPTSDNHQQASPRRRAALELGKPTLAPMTGPEHTAALRALAALLPDLDPASRVVDPAPAGQPAPPDQQTAMSAPHDTLRPGAPARAA